MSVIANLLRDILNAIGAIGSGTTGVATEAKQDIGNASLSSLDSKTPALVSGSVPVYVTNQLDITTISSYLLDIKNSCADIDANTDAVESKLDSIVSAINANGAVNHADLLAVVAELQAVDANTDAQESILTNILNKLIVSPATLAEQQTQTTALNNIEAKTPVLIDSKSPVLSMDYGLAVSRGLISGVTTKSISGYNLAARTTLEPIWSASNSNYVWLTGATSVQIASSSAIDTSAGTGARTVLVNYLKTDFSEVNQLVTLNGITPVTIAADVYRINQVVCLSWGANQSNVGELWIGTGIFSTITGFTNNLSKIEIGENIAQQAIYTVPANKVFEGLAFRTTLSAPTRFRLQYKTAASTGFITTFNLPLDSSQAFTSPFAIVFSAGTDIIVQAQSLGGTIQVGMIISGFLRSV